MLADSIDLIAAAGLFAAAVGAWWLSAPLRSRERLYLRFAAVLLAGLAASVPFSLADVTVLFLLPLAAGALMVSALAARMPVGLAALVLVLALAGGLAALVTGLWPLALLPAVLAGLAIMAAAINGLALMPALAGASLLAAGLVFVEQGAHAALLLFAAAALMGLVPRLAPSQLLRSSSSAMRPRRAVP